MNLTVFISALLILQVICLFIGKKASKQLSTQEDYFLAGRGIRFFPLLMTLIATQIGGGLVLGSAEEAYRHGWLVLFYPLGASLGLLLLAAGIGKRLSQFKVSTVAQLFEVVYQSTRLKKIASILSIVSLFMILIAQIIASKKFMVSLGATDNWLFLSFWGIVILYTVSGGLKAVVATDIIQALFFIVVFASSFIYTLFSQNIEISTSAWKLSENFDFNSAKLCGWLLMPLLFMVIEQDMAQRCFAAKSGRTVSLASGCAALSILLVCIIPVFYGMLAKSIGLEVPQGASVLMTVLAITTNPMLSALFGCAIIAAIISTADSLINAISSNVAQDFDFKIFRNGKVNSSQWVTGLIGCSALLASFYFNNIVDVLIQSYELSVSCLFVSVFAALFVKRGNALSATLSVIFGALAFVVFRWYPVDIVPREVISLGFSMLGYLTGEVKQKVSANAYKVSH